MCMHMHTQRDTRTHAWTLTWTHAWILTWTHAVNNILMGLGPTAQLSVAGSEQESQPHVAQVVLLMFGHRLDPS